MTQVDDADCSLQNAVISDASFCSAKSDAASCMLRAYNTLKS